MLFYSMTSASIHREMAEYRGYSLQVTHTPPQWQVVIGAMLENRPKLAPEKTDRKRVGRRGNPEARKNED